MAAANHTLPDLDALNPNELKALIFSQHEQLIVARQRNRTLEAADRQAAPDDSSGANRKSWIARSSNWSCGWTSWKPRKQRRSLLRKRLLLSHPLRTSRETGAAAAARASAARNAEDIRRSRPLARTAAAELKHLGEDVSEILEYVPARFKVIRQVRPKLACACCERIVQAEAPSRPIERGIAGPGLLAHVLVSKYCDHLPLYRQSEIYAREGVELERSTLADWVGGTSTLLAPLVEALRRHVMSATKLHADDTPVPVLAPGNGKTKTGAAVDVCAR